MPWPTFTGLAAYGGSNNWVNPTYSMVTALWASGSCSGLLRNDGTCVLTSSFDASGAAAARAAVGSCTAGQYGTATTTSGLTCAQVAYSQLSGTPALPNGTTATTQSPGDSSTDVATDAFVASAAAPPAYAIGGSPAVYGPTQNNSGRSITGGGGNMTCLGIVNDSSTDNGTTLRACAALGIPIILPNTCQGSKGVIMYSGGVVFTAAGQILRGTGSAPSFLSNCPTILQSLDASGVEFDSVPNAVVQDLTIAGPTISFTGTTDGPSQTCSSGTNQGLYAVSTTFKMYRCVSTTWNLISGAQTAVGLWFTNPTHSLTNYSSNYDHVIDVSIYGFSQAMRWDGVGDSLAQNFTGYTGLANGITLPTVQMDGTTPNSNILHGMHITCKAYGGANVANSTTALELDGGFGDNVIMGDSTFCPLNSISSGSHIIMTGDVEQSTGSIGTFNGGSNNVAEQTGTVTRTNTTSPLYQVSGGSGLTILGFPYNASGGSGVATNGPTLQTPTVNSSNGSCGTTQRCYTLQNNNPSGASPQSNEKCVTPSSGSSNQIVLNWTQMAGVEYVTVNEGATTGSELVMQGISPILQANTTTWTDNCSLTTSGSPPSATMYYPWVTKSSLADEVAAISAPSLGTTKVSGGMGDDATDSVGESYYLPDHTIEVNTTPSCTFATRKALFYTAATLTSGNGDGYGICIRNAAGSYVYTPLVGGSYLSTAISLNDTTTTNVQTTNQSGVGTANPLYLWQCSNSSASCWPLSLGTGYSSGFILKLLGPSGVNDFTFSNLGAGYYKPLVMEQLGTAVSGTNQNSQPLTSQISSWNGSAAQTSSFGWTGVAQTGTNPNVSYNLTYSAGGNTGVPSVNLTAATGGVFVAGLTNQALTTAGMVTNNGSGLEATLSGAANMPLLGAGASATPAFSTIAYPTSCTAGGILGGSTATALACSAYTANAVPKMASSAGTPTASSIIDNGTYVTTTELIHGGGSVQLTADTSGITATTAATATTVFTLPALNASTKYTVHCSGTTTQATAGGGIGIAIQTATTAATNMELHATVATGPTAMNSQSSGSLSTTTESAIYTGVTGTVTTQLPWTVDGTIEVGATAPSSIVIGFFSASASDAVVVKRDSACSVLP